MTTATVPITLKLLDRERFPAAGPDTEWTVALPTAPEECAPASIVGSKFAAIAATEAALAAARKESDQAELQRARHKSTLRAFSLTTSAEKVAAAEAGLRVLNQLEPTIRTKLEAAERQHRQARRLVEAAWGEFVTLRDRALSRGGVSPAEQLRIERLVLGAAPAGPRQPLPGAFQRGPKYEYRPQPSPAEVRVVGSSR